MNIGFTYKRQSLYDVMSLLSVLQKFPYHVYDTQFCFFGDKDTYYFTTDYPHGYDRKIILDHRENIFDLEKYRDYNWKTMRSEGYDKIIFTLFEASILNVNNVQKYINDINVYLDAGNILISVIDLPINHPNYLFCPFLIFNLFYYYYGFAYLNYYKFNKKNNLLGVYFDNNHNHKVWRSRIIDYCNDLFNEDFLVYNVHSEDSIKTTLQGYNSFGFWGQNHITTYTDYTTSVCNILFETFATNEDGSGRLGAEHGSVGSHMTEKTMKGIIFGEEQIFFIWYGPEYWFDFLIKSGFWFLNVEFYTGCVLSSTKDSLLYLKKLKESLGTNENVHKFLLEKYGQKLESNVNLMKEIIYNSPYTEKILGVI